MSEVIPEPPSILLELSKLCCITSVSVDRRLVSNYDVELWFTFTDSEGKSVCEIPDHIAALYHTNLDITFPIVRMKTVTLKWLADWKKFEQKNKRDIADYKRLKAKFDPPKE